MKFSLQTYLHREIGNSGIQIFPKSPMPKIALRQEFYNNSSVLDWFFTTNTLHRHIKYQRISAPYRHIILQVLYNRGISSCRCYIKCVLLHIQWLYAIGPFLNCRVFFAYGEEFKNKLLHVVCTVQYWVYSMKSWWSQCTLFQQCTIKQWPCYDY